MTTRGIEGLQSDTSYIFSAVLVAETRRTGRGVETTYDLLTGLDDRLEYELVLSMSLSSVSGSLVA